MISIFHGDDAETHRAFQAWRRANVNGFHMSEGPVGEFTIHYTQDRRENAARRGCWHQGGSGSGNDYQADKGQCYTIRRKVCSNSVDELIAWAKANGFKAWKCGHCNTQRFPL